jgi:sarcosine oxidase subunit delta
MKPPLLRLRTKGVLEMLEIHCPYCEEKRSELEFAGAGEAHIARPTDMLNVSDDDLLKYLYIRDNHKGVQFERWRHIHGCGRFFNAVRDSVSDKFLMTYKAGEKKPTKAQIDALVKKAGVTK